MIKPKTQENEYERIENLKSYNILDTLPEKEYDQITYLASQICKTPISLISLIDEKRQWFKSHHGLEATETPNEFAFCSHAINEADNIFIVPDSRIDERFHDNPLVTDSPFVIFYAGIPLVTPKGFSLGTLCVIDNVPRILDESQILALKALANQLVKLLELRISLIELRKSEEKLKELNATKDKLFSIIGHDLRGHISGFKSLVELMISDFDLSDSKNLMDVLHIIQKSAASTYDLLENLLAWANSQRNEIVYSPEEIKLNEVVLFSVDLFNELTQNKGITIINNIPNNTIVFADKNMLMIVLRNIISNAIKFTANGKQIIISTYSKGNQQIVKIQDEGTGILPENLLKLFKNTEHITTYGTIGEKGCGLGLLLCKDFIEKNSGEIWVESEIDKGSVFSFSLPIENTLLPE
jgi:signal transduction histidine kinase